MLLKLSQECMLRKLSISKAKLNDSSVELLCIVIVDDLNGLEPFDYATKIINELILISPPRRKNTKAR